VGAERVDLCGGGEDGGGGAVHARIVSCRWRPVKG
jgi:hypothetical protein